MARRQYANSATNPTTTLAADIDIGDSTVTLAADPGSEMPTSAGPFSFTVGESPNTKPFNAASRSGTTITLVGTAATAHTAGEVVNTEPHKTDADKWIQAGEAEIVNADVSASAAIASSKLSGVIDTSATGQTKTGALTVSAAVTGASFVASADGSAAATPYGFSIAGYGMFKLSTSLAFATAGTMRAVVNANGLSVVGSVSPTGQVNAGVAAIGTSYTTSQGSPGDLEITANDSDVYLHKFSFGGTAITTVNYIKDVQYRLGGGNECRVWPFSDGVSDYNTLNEKHATQAVWDDLGWGDGEGPGGSYAVLDTPGGHWRLTRLQTDPGHTAGFAFPASGSASLALVSDGSY